MASLSFFFDKKASADRRGGESEGAAFKPSSGAGRIDQLRVADAADLDFEHSSGKFAS